MLLQHHCLFIQILILFVDLPQHQQGRPPEGLRSGQGKQPGKVSLTNYIRIIFHVSSPNFAPQVRAISSLTLIV